MANIAQSVNVLSPLMTSKTGITKQTTWWPYELFCKYMKGDLIAVHVGCEFYDGTTKPVWLRSVKETPMIDVAATIDDEGMVSMCVINRHLERTFETEIGGVVGEVQVFTVTGENETVSNMFGKEEVSLEESKWEGKGKFVFGKHSLTMLRWKSG
jgi:alpha-N-arabinofuranosidase